MYLIFDTETTGLPDFKAAADAPGQPRVCSLAAALVTRDGEIAASFYDLIHPTDWSQEVISKAANAFSVNGLSVERLEREGKPVVEVLEAYDNLVDQCDGIAAFGVAFDQKMLRAEQRIAGRRDRYGERPTFCIQHAARPLCKIPAAKGGFKQPKLAEAMQALFGEDLPDAHDAQVDLKATVRIFNLMQERGLVTWKPQVSKDAAA